MRVTQALLSDRALTAVRQGLERIARTQGRLASGRRVEVPGDDPTAHAAATRLGARLGALEQLARQAGAAREALEAADGALDGLLAVMGRVEELAIRGADGSQGASERAAIATEVNHLLEEAVALANSRENGRYVFGGRETLTPPLSVTRNAAGDITAASWNPRGVDGAIDLDVAEGVQVRTNLGGTSVLGAAADPTFLPAVLIQLRDALAANDPVTVNGLLDELETARGRIADGRAVVGSRLATVDRALDDDQLATLATTAALSAAVDADAARLAVDLARQESVYQAALHAASRAIQPTLLEFLR